MARWPNIFIDSMKEIVKTKSLKKLEDSKNLVSFYKFENFVYHHGCFCISIESFAAVNCMGLKNV